MNMWRLIMLIALAITGMCIFYLSYRLGKFSFVKSNPKKLKFFGGAFFVVLIFAVIAFLLKPVNAVIVVFYLTLFSLLSDLLVWLYQKIIRHRFKHDWAFPSAILLTFLSLLLGWYNAHHVWQTDYTLTTNKKVPNLKVALIADSHINTTFDGDGFEGHLQKIQEQNPDIVIVAGDFVDDDTTRTDMIKSVQALGKIKTTKGIYFVFGNHDKGYYGAERRGFNVGDLMNELNKNNIHVLRDEVVLIDNAVYLIGRRDQSETHEGYGSRKSMQDLIKDLDKSKYMLVIDHQPTDYQNQIQSGVDLVLSGHTHGGQLFPFNYVSQWLKINDKTYGYERRGETDFIVTSGISDWAIRFKTGTQSEYVIITLSHNKQKYQNQGDNEF